jgi:hypothetical protein
MSAKPCCYTYNTFINPFSFKNKLPTNKLTRVTRLQDESPRRSFQKLSAYDASTVIYDAATNDASTVIYDAAALYDASATVYDATANDTIANDATAYDPARATSVHDASSQTEQSGRSSKSLVSVKKNGY